MSAGAARAMEIIGIIVVILGGFYWYGSPNDVIVGPIVVVLIGLAVIGVARWRHRDYTHRPRLKCGARSRSMSAQGLS